MRSLKRVVDGEKFEVENGALEALSDRVDGSFREAHKLLEQLSFEGKITLESVQKLTSIVSANPAVLISKLVERDTKAAIDEINLVSERGVNLKVYTTEIVSILRREMLAKAKGEKSELTLSLIEVQKLIELFAEAIKQLPTAVVPQLPLEMAIVRWCAQEISDKRYEISNKKETNVTPASSGDKEEKASQTSDSGAKIHQSAPYKDEKEKDNPKVNPEPADIEPVPVSTELERGEPEKLEVVKVDSSDLHSAWVQIMSGTKKKNTSVEALLRAARPLGYDGHILKIEVFYKFHKDRLEAAEYRSLVEEIASAVLGSPSQIICVLSQEKKRAADITNVAPPSKQDEEIVNLAEQIFGTTGDGKVH